jgi:predicted dehydrogenase
MSPDLVGGEVSKPLKIAVLGFWHVHAGDYARQAEQHPGTELVAVWDDDPALGQPGADQFGVPFTADLGVVLARGDLDGVVITTATSAHRDIMVAAANAGKHIFTEKLLAPTVTETTEIIAAADDNDVKLVVSLPRLAHGYTQAIRDVSAAATSGSSPTGGSGCPTTGPFPATGTRAGCRNASSTRRPPSVVR